MWNYSFMVPCALVMLTVFGFYAGRIRLPMRLNSIFFDLFVIQVLVFVLDVVSTRMDELSAQFDPVSLYVANALFFVVYLARIFWFCRFTWALLGLNVREHRALAVLKYTPIVLAELLCVTSSATGLVFSIQNGAYVSGPLYHLLAATYAYYVAFSLALLYRYRMRLRQREVAGAVAYNMVLLAGTVVRVLLPRLLVMDTFCVIAVLVIYLVFVNPDLYLAENGVVFNRRGLNRLMAESERQRDYYLLGFALQNYVHERSVVGGRTMDEAIELVCKYMRDTFPRTVPFYVRGGRFVLMGDEHTEWGIVRAKILDRFEHSWQTEEASLHLRVVFAYVDSNSSAEMASRLVNNLIIVLDDARRNASGELGDEGAGMLSVNAVNQQVEVMRALEYALENDRVEAYLQPIFDSKTHAVVGAEALARIRDAQGNIVSPSVFVPLAERSGTIHQLGRQMLQQTCAFIQANNMDTLGMQWVNVNLSPLQCMQNNLAGEFYNILEEYRVPAELIHLELTEQSMVDYSLLKRQIGALKEGGFEFVLDDYGTGYSNLTRVKHYPFITVKIDMEVVWDYYQERDALLPILVEGFKRMGLSVTAEGIETADMAHVLTDIGCDYLQGYYFSEPVPPQEFLERFGARLA